MGKWLMAAGAVLLLAGIVVTYAPWLVSWFGRLPGDLRITSGNTRVFFPLTSMIVISLVLSIVLSLLRRWLP